MIMNQEVPYVNIGGKNYLPQSTYEIIEKRKDLRDCFYIGIGNLVGAAGIAVFNLGYAQGHLDKFVENIKDSNLESVLFWGGLFIFSSLNAYIQLSEAHRLRNELNN